MDHRHTGLITLSEFLISQKATEFSSMSFSSFHLGGWEKEQESNDRMSVR